MESPVASHLFVDSLARDEVGEQASAYGALQVGLGQIEAAHRFDSIDLDKLRAE